MSLKSFTWKVGPEGQKVAEVRVSIPVTYDMVQNIRAELFKRGLPYTLKRVRDLIREQVRTTAKITHGLPGNVD